MNTVFLTGSGYSSTGSVLELIGLLILFVLVLAACYYVTKFVAGKQMAPKNASNFAIIDTLRISQNKYLQIVQTGKKYIVIAVCKETVSVLTELNEEELLYIKDSKSESADFKEILLKTFKKNSSVNEMDAYETHIQTKENRK